MAPYNSVIQEAYNIVNGSRAESHGDFKDNFERTAKIFNAWTGHDLSSEDVAKFMQCLKMAREYANPDNRDNLVDQAGYIELRCKLLGEMR